MIQLKEDKIKKKVALIFGITGQDGALLSRLLLAMDYSVIGTSRYKVLAEGSNLHLLKVHQKIKIVSLDVTDYTSVLSLIENVAADEIYCLAAQSSVSLSFIKPKETIDSIITGTLNVLEAVKNLKRKPRIYFAGSSECFGETRGQGANETTRFNPRSPYGVAKSSAHWLAKNYHKNYGIYACTGFLFNHESPLRPKHFVTQKIVQSCIRIAKGSEEKLELGNVAISRDWGWAPEYVQAMWMMLQLPEPTDLIVATGQSNTLKNFVELSFKYFQLDWRNHVTLNQSLFRETDIIESSADTAQVKSTLNWRPKKMMEDVIVGMIEARLD
jgi:GDPmannose 4,6-dehydratase